MNQAKVNNVSAACRIVLLGTRMRCKNYSSNTSCWSERRWPIKLVFPLTLTSDSRLVMWIMVISSHRSHIIRTSWMALKRNIGYIPELREAVWRVYNSYRVGFSQMPVERLFWLYRRNETCGEDKPAVYVPHTITALKCNLNRESYCYFQLMKHTVIRYPWNPKQKVRRRNERRFCKLPRKIFHNMCNNISICILIMVYGTKPLDLGIHY